MREIIKSVYKTVRDNINKIIVLAVGIICIIVTACIAQRTNRKPPPEIVPVPIETPRDVKVSVLPTPLKVLETYDLLTYTLQYEGAEYVVIEKKGAIAISKK